MSLGGGGGGSDIDIGVDELKKMTPQVRAGGLKLRLRDLGDNESAVVASSSPERRNVVRGLADAFKDKAGEFATLRNEVTPGFGRLTTSRLQDLEDQRRRRVGDLSQQLARRRILGSNFARDEISREEAGFNQERDRIKAESFLTELSLSTDLINQQYTATAQEFNTLLTELNTQYQGALQMASNAQPHFAALQQQATAMNAQIAQQGSGLGQALGSLAGTVAGSFLGPMGSAVGGAAGSALGGAISG